MNPVTTSRAAVICAFCLAGLAAACGDDHSSSPGKGGRSPTGSGGDSAGPLYAMLVQVYDEEDRTVYVSLSDTIDLESTELGKAREFAGVANFAAIDGKLLVSSGLEPTITEFEITADQKWVEGRSVSFAAYPLSDNANFYAQFIVDEEHVIFPYESTKRILWNPSTMEIERTLEDSSLPAPEKGMTLEPGGNRNSVHYEGSVMQAYLYHDEDWHDYGEKSHVVVYDQKTFEESRVVDVPCPGLSLATRDEDGNTYFATWDLSGTSLLGEAPPMCIAKVDSEGERLDTFDPREWTDGRAVNNFRYIGNGKAVANVLHHEELGVTSTTMLDADQLEDLYKSGPKWKLWLFDVEKGRGAPVEGVDIDVSSGAQFAVLEGRTFVFVPYDDWARTKTYELHDDGTATLHFDTTGDVFKWIRVR